MTTRQLKAALGAADPIEEARLEGLDFAAMEADLLADVGGLLTGLTAPAARPRRPRPRRLALTLAAASLAAAALLVLLLVGGGDGRPTRAYGAELVRFAESTPLLLLEGPGWRVQNVTEYREPEGLEGSMEFVTGRPVPFETIHVHANGTESGGLPPSVRQRKVELSWRRGSLAQWLEYARKAPHPPGQRWLEVPVLGTTAHLNTRAEGVPSQGGSGDREMSALWSEGGWVLELRAAVPDLAAFEERLGWLGKVDSQTWLDAMPAKVVKAAEHGAAVREMLKGIPVPAIFEPSLVPAEGLTTDRYQVGAAVTGTVSCLWFLQWAEARREGDPAKAAEAERAMASARHWPILREMAKEGAYPNTIWELAAEMPKGYWVWAGHRRPLLPRAEGLGCARRHMPLLPWKQRRQGERGELQLPPASG
ncbi:MAG TPA: hypothetical protein VF731_10530 [Solirubrobacterales bacterium]